MKVKRYLLSLALLAGLLVVAACGAEAPPSEPAAGSVPPAAPVSEARVFFIEPLDGATVKSPVTLRFGIANYEIAPVPEGTAATVRSGIGHHHVGVDADCLSPGTEIPKADPWIHFGDGKAEMTMQLTPGPHKLSLQVGDDLHTTIPGLCSTINIMVAQ